VLQRLSLPLHDLSRGATIEDIVKIVVITAIQAQQARPVAGSRAGKARSIINTKNPAR
jgi:Phosphate acetyl/butaryl transferase